MSRAVLVCGVLFAVVGSSSAQKAGDAFVMGSQVGPVALNFGFVPAGGAQLLNTVFSSSRYGGGAALAVAPGNNGIAFTAIPIGPPRAELLGWSNSTLTTIAMLPASVSRPASMQIDQHGDFVLLNSSTSAAVGGLFRVSAANPTSVTTIATGIPDALGFWEEPSSGDYIVTRGAASTAGDLIRVTPQGVVTSVRGVFPAVGIVAGAQQPDYANDTALVGLAGFVFRVDAKTAALTTVVVGMPLSPTIVGLADDPLNGLGYLCDGNAVHRFNPQSGASTLLARFGLYFASDVSTWRSRFLTGTSRAAVGQRYGIAVSMPGEAGRSYQAAASLGTQRGLQTPAGRIPLDPDPLFFLSLNTPAIFARFAGVLGNRDSASLDVFIPNAIGLRGVRFFVGVVTYDATGIRMISTPLGVTIR